MEDRKSRKQTAQQKLNNFLRSELAKNYPLDSSRRIVLHALASYFYYKEICNPSIKSLRDYTQFSDSYLREVIQVLESLGLIKILRKNGSKNEYLWLIPSISDEEIYNKKAVHKSQKSKKKTKTPPLQRGGNPAATRGWLN